MNSFYNAQFNYCLRLIYNDKNSSYKELLTKDGSASIHPRNIQALATELYKFKNGLSPKVFTEILARESHYNLRRCSDFRIPSIHTVYHGSESISFFRN